MSLYHLDNARSEEQRAEMARLEAEGVCLFCPGYLTTVNDHPILLRTRHWMVTGNRYPYRGTTAHLLLVPDEHVCDLVDLTPQAQQDFWTALAWVREHHSLTYYGVGVRNGDPRFTGGTIRHLHVHVIVGDPGQEPVKMKFSDGPQWTDQPR